MRMSIEVTEEDFKEGLPSGTNCPIARALSKHFTDVYVNANGGAAFTAQAPDASIHIGSRVFAFQLPERVKQFIHDFDNYKHDMPFEPFSFVIDL